MRIPGLIAAALVSASLVGGAVPTPTPTEESDTIFTVQPEPVQVDEPLAKKEVPATPVDKDAESLELIEELNKLEITQK